jgi:hypothetical protein
VPISEQQYSEEAARNFKIKVSSPLERTPDNTVGKKKKCGPKLQ